MPDKTPKALSFEQSLTQLEKLVSKMESGQLPLEQSLKHFEQGVKLIGECQTVLSKAEQKVKMLSGEGVLVDYNPSE
ncbi:MAG TPA: exodeoxyribonuclease VII small subunit [Coxiellaceae bacterium]|nr:exodeoxyribonuclease VII small subunit [Coxiellaceae bacterium]